MCEPAPSPREHAPRFPRALAPLLGLAVVLCGCGGGRARPNVLLITLDTTRADRLGCYGYAAAETPHLDALAASGVRFDRAYAPAPLTLPAHTSLLTGRYPPRHGVLHNGLYRLPESVPTLAERFQQQGYRTAAVIAASVLNSVYGLARGFDRYVDVPSRPPQLERPNFAPTERDAEAVTRLALEWLKAQKDAPWFLWVHYYDPHAPYFPHGPDPGDRSLRYDREIAYVDRAVGRLLEALRERGGDWVVVVAGDHGEALEEHGELTHGYFVYEEVMRVPLLFSGAGVPAGKTVEALVSLVDVAPTVLELAGLAAMPDVDGESLVALWETPEGTDDAATRAVYMEARMAELQYGWSPLFAMRRGPWKFIEAPQRELYDLQADPEELRNLYPEPPAGQMARDLAAWRANLEQAGPGEAGRREISPEELDRLRSLGYLQGPEEPPGPEPEAQRPDPKDKLAVYRQLEAASVLTVEGSLQQAVAVLMPLAKEDPGNPYLQERLVRALMAAHRFEEAERYARVGLEAMQARRLPEEATRTLRVLLANLCHRSGKLDEAARILDEILAKSPEHLRALRERMYLDISLGQREQAVARARRYASVLPEDPTVRSEAVKIAARAGDDAAVLELGLVLLETKGAGAEALTELGRSLERRGDLERAERAFRRAVEQDPQDYRAWWGLGRIAFARGDAGAALEAFRKAVEAEPRHATAWYNLGVANLRAGRLDEAREALNEALELEPSDLDTQLALARVEEREGRRAEACATYRRVLELAPGDRAAREGAARTCGQS